MKKVYLGMSGGVDSSVAAVLLQEQGYEVTGVYMKNWAEDLPGMQCPWAEDLADAKRVAVKLGIDFEVWDFEKEYKEKVVDYILSEFKVGRTPNPDVMCNQEIKFKLFFEKAMERGAEFIATGHYAQIGIGGLPSDSPACPAGTLRAALAKSSCPAKHEANHLEARLLQAVDGNKDQTYFLYRMSDEALARTIFPVGGMMKSEVKKLAAERGLKNAYKKESMGVCFVGEVAIEDFLKEYIEVLAGDIVEAESGKVLGRHTGAVFYTLGQRHGLYLGGGMPYYVVGKDMKENIVYVSRDLNKLWTREVCLRDIFWRGGLERSGRLMVRLRHRAALVGAELIYERDSEAVPDDDENVDGDAKKNAKLVFDEDVKRPAPGQSAVFYIGEECVGGGIVADE